MSDTEVRYVAKRTDDELLDGPKAIARDLSLPGGGRAKLGRIIDNHLDWFVAARERGFEWSDIVRLLYKEGITRPDGRPLSRGHLSSLVWRKLATLRGDADQVNEELPVDAERAKPARQARTTEDRPRSGRTKERKLPTKASSNGSVAPGVSTSPARESDAAGNDLLEYMRRAARVRGN